MSTNETKTPNEDKSEQLDLNHFYYLLAAPNEAKEYIETLKKYFNDYYIFNTTQYNTLNRLYFKISSEKENKNFIDTPIYQLESEFKKLIQIQLKMFESISQKFEIFNLIEVKLVILENLILELSPKFNHFALHKDFYNETNSIFNSLMKTMDDLEAKTVDEYIWKKYNRHLYEAGDENVDDLVTQIKNLENKMLYNAQDKKNQYYFKLNESYDTVQNIYNNIKLNFDNYALYLKELNHNYINDLENLINKMNSNLSIEEIKNKEDITSSKSDIELNEKDFFPVKYKIKILKNHNLTLKKENNDNIEEQNDKKQKIEKTKLLNQNVDLDKINKKYEEQNIFLTGEDIYEIISKLYSYNLKIIDKSNYILESEKEKLIANDLSNKLLLYCEDNEDCKNKLNEEYKEIMESINTKIVNNIKNIESFFYVLNNYRVSGKLNFNEKFYDIVVYIFNKAQDILIKNNNTKLEDLMIILSQTYYKEINGKKIYLLEETKSHDIYKNIEFWKSLIVKSIENDMKLVRKISSSNNIRLEKKEDIVTNKFITFSNLMKELNVPLDKILDVFGQIMDKYKFIQASKNKIISVLKNL